MSRRILLARNLAKRLFPLALAVYFLIGIGFPVVYYTLESKALARSAEIYAREFADQLKKLILISPALWKYEAEKYMEVMENFLPHKDITDIQIVDENGKLITHYEAGSRKKGNTLMASAEGSAPIIFNNRILGSVRMGVSLRHILDKTLVIFLFCSSLGAALTALLYFFPVNIAKGMEKQIKELVEALRNSGEESERLRISAERSERRFRDLVQGLDAIVWEAEKETFNFTFVSRKAEDILGYPLEMWYKPHFLDGLIFPDDLERVMALYRDAALGKEAVNEFDYRLQAPDGRIVWIRDKVRLAQLQDAPAASLQGLMVDIAERKMFTDVLATEKNRLAVTLRSIADGVITSDTNGLIVSMNRVAEQLTGWDQEAAAGRHLNDVFRIMDEKKQWFINPLDYSATQKSVTDVAGPALLAAADDNERLIERAITPMKDFEGKEAGAILVFRDITEKRKMEEELLNIQKLESIRVLAGGIAHDFNNLLTSIVGNISIARRYAAGEARLFGILTDLEKASFRAHDLTNQLLTFSKGGAPVKKVASLSDIIRESADFALRGSQLICKFMIADDLWPAEVDVGQISQVMNNIVINASQAMPQGGAIEILAENVIGNTQKAPIPQGRCVKISIGDHGAGIPEKYLPKIFDPFFTTKQEGSGLGLATAYSIIRKHSGHITVETKEALGTTFHVYLPASDEEVSKNGLTGKRVFAGKGRVLLMDDEDIIRLIVDSMLHELGYQSDTVENGEHAIERYMAAGEEGRPFDAVIIDLTIRGGMGGTETIRKLREIDPDVRAIVSSGYFNDPIMSSYREFGFKGVITKPYRIEDLSEVLYKVLHGITDYHV